MTGSVGRIVTDMGGGIIEVGVSAGMVRDSVHPLKNMLRTSANAKNDNRFFMSVSISLNTTIHEVDEIKNQDVPQITNNPSEEPHKTHEWGE